MDDDPQPQDVEPLPVPPRVEGAPAAKPTAQPKTELSPEQAAAVAAAKAGKSLFITGPGGTGKSHLLQVLVKELKQMGREVALTALTGCAALLLSNMPNMPVKAKTLHSWAGVGLGRGSLESLVRGIVTNYHKKKNWVKTDVLIVDEVSMLTPSLLDLLDKIGRHVRKRPFQPMGGLRVIFVGDFHQLPPVGRDDPDRIFAFQSPAWPQLVQETIQLKTIFRQADPVFQKVLEEARVGALSAESFALLEGRKSTAWKGQQIRPTLLFTRNADVDAINEKHFEKLAGDAVAFRAKTVFSRPDQTEAGLSKFIEFMDKDAPYEAHLELKVGAQVMLVRNVDPDLGLVNGSRGVVLRFSEATGWPIVRFLGGATVEVKPQQWESDTDPSFWREQIPLRLAWAHTIHKCVSEDTLLAIPGRGLVPIKSIAGRSQQPNSVYTPSDIQVAGIHENKSIVEVFKGDIESGLRFTTTFGYEITTSNRHPLLVFNAKSHTFEWKIAPTITTGDSIVLKKGASVEGEYYSLKRIPFTNQYNRAGRIPEYLNEDVAYYIGVMLGDGSINQKTYRFDLLGIDLDILEGCVKILKEQFGINVETHVIPKRNTHTERIFFHSKQLVEMLRGIGYTFQKADKKEIPDVILQSPLSVQKALIQGLYDTDGGVAKQIIHFTTTSEKMGCQIQQILLNLGIPVSRNMMRDEIPDRNWKKVYRLNMSGASSLKFMKSIGFRCERKNRMAEDGVREKSSPRKNTKSQAFEIPNGAALIQRLRDEMRNGLKRIKSSDITSKGSEILSSIASGTQVLRCESLNYIVSQIPNIEQYPTGKLLSFINTNGIIIDTIKNINTVNDIQMYDIGVSPLNKTGFLPDGHDFIGNGFVNHNSQGSSLDSALVDIGKATFEYGQAYVALSRVRSLEGLWVYDLDAMAFKVHPAVEGFYGSLAATK